jgi:hypothetical protein
MIEMRAGVDGETDLFAAAGAEGVELSDGVAEGLCSYKRRNANGGEKNGSACAHGATPRDRERHGPTMSPGNAAVNSDQSNDESDSLQSTAHRKRSKRRSL